MIRFEDTISDILAADTSDFYERDPETFFASQMGLCPRQLYLSKLGLTANDELQGQYRITRLIQAYLEDRLSDQYPRLKTETSIQITEGPIQFIGRCNLVDPKEEVVYSLKTRNGWYKFTPPVDRHLDQLYIYMRGVGVSQGKITYVSKNDLDDVREWPPSDEESPYLTFDQDRYDQLVAKAKRIRDTIWTDGIATTPGEVPFQNCGCYFCQDEQLDFPNTTENTPSDTPDPVDTSNESNDCNSSVCFPSVMETTTGTNETTKIEADIGVKGSNTIDESTTVLQPDEIHVPNDLRNRDIWVVWDGRSKIALAPWQESTMYPCEWAESKKIDPRRSFDKAKMVAELPVKTIHESWPFPDSNDLPKTVKPAVLLPHDPPTPPIIFVDLDDVRDPETGHVSNEIRDIVDRLGGYTEVSSSGTGLHVYVRGSLPDTIGMFTAPLADRGTIEIYDHARFTGGTWRHVKDTPKDTVPKAQGVIKTLVEKYGDRQPQSNTQIS